MKPSQLSLTNLGGGVAVEKFGDELAKVVENILDPKTEAGAMREISLKVKIKPAQDRTFGAVLVETNSKLAPNVAYGTKAFFGVDKEGLPLAFGSDPKQTTITDFMGADTTN